MYNTKGYLNGNYKDGRTNKKYFCIDCDKEISRWSGFYGSHRCGSCATIFRHKTQEHPTEGLRRFGKDNPNWKGGLVILKELIRGLLEYKNWKNKIFERDNYTCQECYKHGGNLEAHHKTPFIKIFYQFLKDYNQFSPLEEKEILVRLATKYNAFWNIDIGVTLCTNCHNITKKEVEKHAK